MDGGIDAVYMGYFGEQIQTAVRKQIFDFHHGELVIGNADIISTENQSIPYLIIAPTMRVPMILHDSINAYLAARAVLILYKHRRFNNGKYTEQKISDRKPL